MSATSADNPAGPLPVPEFSRLFAVDAGMGSGEDARRIAIEAKADECVALARRFGLISLDRLTADARLEVFARGRRARLSGRLVADVVQSCVVSLAPVTAHIEQDFELDFDREADRFAGEPIDPDAADPPDHLPEEGVDAGEAVAEQLGLALDPYPRAPGISLDAVAPKDILDTGQGSSISPFAGLGRLKEPGDRS
jgi:uncharacterized metal-binding protein YceD (DUF177 family)